MIKLLAVIFTLLLMISIVNAEEGSTAQLSQRASHSGGEGSKHSTGQVLTARDIARITYPSVSTAQSEGGLRPKAILLVKPQRFDREGVYVWRDAEGVWNIRLISKAELALTGNISTAGNIEAIKVSSPGFIMDGSTNALIEQRSLPNKELPPIQFKVNGPEAVFDLLIDGQRDPSLVYLGLRGRNPKHVPFKLENRPVLATQESAPLSSSQSVGENSGIPSSTSFNALGESGSAGGGGGSKEKK